MASGTFPHKVVVPQPHPARIYDYLLGGRDNFAADRAVAEQAIAAWPGIRVAAVENRAFIGRAVRYLTGEAGIDQFLDIGSGLPAAGNVHEVAQAVNPDARVVYVDNDEIVAVHARALLSSDRQGKSTFIHGDLRDPETILADLATRDTLDLGRPIALLLVAVLHYIPDEEDPRRIIKALVDRLPSGSYVVAAHGTPEYTPQETAAEVELAYRAVETHARPAAEFADLVFRDLELVPPGVVPTSEWRPSAPEPRPAPSDVAANAGVAKKP